MPSSLFRLSGALAMTSALLLAAVPPLAAWADDDTASAEVAGPPVARLSVVQGDVSVQRADAQTAVAATVNAPLLQSDYLSTGPAARAEVQIDSDTALRLNGDVQLRFIDLDPAQREAQLAEGEVELRVFAGTGYQPQIDTPSVSIRPTSAGSVRIAVTPSGETRVTVRSGSADVLWTNGSQPLQPGSTLSVSGNPDKPQFATVDTVGLDEFDAFNNQRDAQTQVASNTTTTTNVNSAIPGTADLGQNGQWRSDPTYGQVWQPAVAATSPTWAPYQDGNWVWEAGYGYTWVSYEPWGWAPYHYGRWFYSASIGGWAWVPPPVAIAPPPWHPALVGFFTFGAATATVGFASIGWVPLAPHEVFHPWYGAYHGWAGVRSVSVVNVTTVNITAYRNAGAPGGLLTVGARRFTNGGIAGHVVAVRPEVVGSANFAMVRGAVPLVPTAANLRFTARADVGASVVPVRTGLFARGALATRTVVAPPTFQSQRAQSARVVHPEAFGGGNAPHADAWSRFGASRAPAATNESGSNATRSYDQRPTTSQSRPDAPPRNVYRGTAPSYATSARQNAPQGQTSRPASHATSTTSSNKKQPARTSSGDHH
jgi:hypothetical protein